MRVKHTTYTLIEVFRNSFRAALPIFLIRHFQKLFTLQVVNYATLVAPTWTVQ